MKRKRGPRALIGTLPALPPQTPLTSAASTEVALHELGESLVTSAVTVQRELRRYGEANGAFMLEDLEMELPVKLRVDSLGQMMAEVVSEPAANSVLTRIRLRIRPDSHPVDAIPIIADAPLARLKTLSSQQIAFLERTGRQPVPRRRAVDSGRAAAGGDGAARYGVEVGRRVSPPRHARAGHAPHEIVG